MAYYVKVLRPDEIVKYTGRLHWIIYKNSIVLSVIFFLSLVIYFNQTEDQKSVMFFASVVFLLLTVMSFVHSWFVRITTEIVVTDKRIIHKTGRIARRTEEMNITKVETVDVSQGIGGRILGFGTVGIKGIGGSWEPLRRIAAPIALRNAIMVG